MFHNLFCSITFAACEIDKNLNYVLMRPAVMILGLLYLHSHMFLFFCGCGCGEVCVKMMWSREKDEMIRQF